MAVLTMRTLMTTAIQFLTMLMRVHKECAMAMILMATAAWTQKTMTRTTTDTKTITKKHAAPRQWTPHPFL